VISKKGMISFVVGGLLLLFQMRSMLASELVFALHPDLSGVTQYGAYLWLLIAAIALVLVGLGLAWIVEDASQVPQSTARQLT